MQILQNMDPDKMVIVLPTALLAMYFIVNLQKSLCEKQNPLIGLILSCDLLCCSDDPGIPATAGCGRRSV